MSPSSLRFQADESCNFTVVRALRALEYDVLAVSEVAPRANDSELIALGAREQRAVLTEDKDFGWLVFASHAESAGVVLIRFPGNARETLARTVAQLVLEHGQVPTHRDPDRVGELTGAFVVVQPGYVRISKKLA